jgi:hypothetical protein
MMKRLIVLLLTAFFVTTASAADCLKCAVKTYVRALNAYDTDKALTFLADELRFVGPDGETTLDKAAVRRMLGWDAATHSAISHTDLEWEGDTIRGTFTERNDFYELLGIRQRSYAIEFRFEGDLIREMRLTPGSWPTVDEALEPFLAWANQRHPETLNRIYPDGNLVLDADSAETWLTLLRRWRTGHDS